MGVFKRRGKEGAGERCEMDEHGVHHCQIFDTNKDGEKVSSGTEFSFQVSKENNCEPLRVGSSDIMEKDKEKVDKIIEQRVKACQRGL